MIWHKRENMDEVMILDPIALLLTQFNWIYTRVVVIEFLLFIEPEEGNEHMDNDEKGNLCQDIPYLDQLCLFFCLNIFYLFSTNTSTDDSGSFQV